MCNAGLSIPLPVLQRMGCWIRQLAVSSPSADHVTVWHVAMYFFPNLKTVSWQVHYLECCSRHVQFGSYHFPIPAGVMNIHLHMLCIPIFTEMQAGMAERITTLENACEDGLLNASHQSIFLPNCIKLSAQVESILLSSRAPKVRTVMLRCSRSTRLYELWVGPWSETLSLHAECVVATSSCTPQLQGLKDLSIKCKTPHLGTCWSTWPSTLWQSSTSMFQMLHTQQKFISDDG